MRNYLFGLSVLCLLPVSCAEDDPPPPPPPTEVKKAWDALTGLHGDLFYANYAANPGLWHQGKLFFRATDWGWERRALTAAGSYNPSDLMCATEWGPMTVEAVPGFDETVRQQLTANTISTTCSFHTAGAEVSRTLQIYERDSNGVPTRAMYWATIDNPAEDPPLPNWKGGTGIDFFVCNPADIPAGQWYCQLGCEMPSPSSTYAGLIPEHCDTTVWPY